MMVGTDGSDARPLSHDTDSLLASVSQTLSLSPASNYQLGNFGNYFNAFHPIVDEEAGFISNQSDLVSLFDTETDWLHRTLNQANLRFFSSKVRPTHSLLAVYTNQTLTRIFFVLVG